MQKSVEKNPLISEDVRITLAPRRKRNRIWEIDFLRGVCVILMILDHLAILLGSYFGNQWYGFDFVRRGVGDAFTTFCYNWINGSASGVRDIIHPIVLFVFFSISGISCTFSRNNAKRGFQLLVVALIYTLGSYIAQNQMGISGVFVAFGVLDFLAVSMLLYALISFLTRDNRLAMIIASIVLIVLTLCLYFCYTPPATTPKIFAIIFASRFLGQPVLILLSIRVFTRRFVHHDTLHRFLFCRRARRRTVLLRTSFSRAFRPDESSLQKNLRRPLRKRRSGKSLRDFSIDALKFMLGAGKVTTAIAKAIEKAVCFFGKHALIVYVVHVVMLAAILSLISGLFITPGNFGF